MPMNRYEIRDEYSLADPELYRAADKDDPEALLEGVAMAGLVGVLRQLGDLAEFAAEIFHDLHEEVTATAARGHNLKIRVQQLEAEVPSVEKAFLSQTDLSSFYYNAGVDWHANLRLDQNLITQGDLPRFVMDSYEECRGPPRLFLLDKFDVAGAGSCLKRYTDPSFFKVETSASAISAVQREKKIRKAKKKGPRGRYGETPETLQASSHAKLHRLLLEDSVENGVTKPAYRARLKRRPNRFPFDSKSGKSYMEDFLKAPEHKMLLEITMSSPLQVSIDDENESPLEHRSVSPARESEGITSNPPYVDIEEITPNPSMNQRDDASVDIKTSGVSSHFNLATDGIPPTFDEETGGKGIDIDGENKMEGSLIDYQSDEIASEIDNYVDAPSTMESEMDTDSEFRGKNDLTSRFKSQPLISVTTQEHCHSLSLDSLSTGDFSISDEGNNSYKKEMSSLLSSDSPRTSAENPQSEKIHADGFPSAYIPEFAIFNAPSFDRTPEQFPADDVPKHMVSNKAFPDNDSGPEERPDVELPTSSLCTANSVPGEGSVRGTKSNGKISDDDEKKRDSSFDSPCSPSASHSKSVENDSQRSSSGEHQVDGEVLRVSASADIIHHDSGSLDGISAYLVNEDDYDQNTFDEFKNMASTMNTDNIAFHNRINTEEVALEENATPVKMDNKVALLTDNFANDYTDISHNEDNVTPEVSEGDQNNLYNKDPNVVSESVSEDHSPVLLDSGLVSFDKEFTPVEPTTINGTSELGIPKTSEVMGLQSGVTDVDLNHDIAPESSFGMPENLEVSSGISYTAEKDGVNPDSGITGQQLSDVPTSVSLKLPSQVPEPLDELDPSMDQSEIAGMDYPVPCFEDLSPGVLENDVTCLSGLNRESEAEGKEKSDLSKSHTESGLLKEVDERETAALDFAALCRKKHDDLPKLEVLQSNLSTYLDSEVKHMVDTVNASQVLTPMEQSGMENQVSDIGSLHTSSAVEESTLPEKIELPSVPSDDKLPDHSEIISSQSSSVILTSQLQMLDHDYDKGSDNLASSSPLPKYPTSFPVLPGLGDYVSVASVYPKDPSGFIFPPGNLFPETNEMNMHQLPSLPPLPPLQWRIGKLQHASSTTEIDKMEINEVFPQPTFPSEISTGHVNSISEQTKQSSSQSPHITVHEENLEQGLPSLEAIAMNETVSLPQKAENEQGQLLDPTEKSEAPSPAEEVGGVAEGSQMAKLPVGPVQIVSQSGLKEVNAEQYSTLEAGSMNQSVDPKVEKEQQQQQHLRLVLPIESEVPSQAMEDEVDNGARSMKLPRSCNPVIGSVAALDKSRLRKVTEQVRPQIQNQDERDALLDQIRAKSFNLKPTATSRPSIQGPNTNLKVAAILEKANAIRQALAGSDEDDEENWSDS